jgi:ketosteroid isomerase-like protein
MRPVNVDTAIFGTYTHIWKKQIDGKWKLLLNSSNFGIGETEENRINY